MELEERLHLTHPFPCNLKGGNISCAAAQRLAGEVVELEERLLQARSRELRAGAEAGREREAAAKARAVAASAEAERAGLKDALRALQVRAPCAKDHGNTENHKTNV